MEQSNEYEVFWFCPVNLYILMSNLCLYLQVVHHDKSGHNTLLIPRQQSLDILCYLVGKICLYIGNGSHDTVGNGCKSTNILAYWKCWKDSWIAACASAHKRLHPQPRFSWEPDHHYVCTTLNRDDSLATSIKNFGPPKICLILFFFTTCLNRLDLLARHGILLVLGPRAILIV